MENEKIVIIGAGLCGSLLALRLAQKGYLIELYENRPDLRKVDISSGRSINLALSNRGLQTLNLTGVPEKVKKLCIPMHGRLIHDTKGNTFSSNYSGRPNQYINSISRQALTAVLLEEADKHENVTIFFNSKCTKINFDTTTAYFKNQTTNNDFSVKASIIFGTDGAGSALRKNYESKKQFAFNFSQDFLTHGYKELEIPAKNGNHQISKNHLHIWPRGNYMLIALPNLDGSFTVTLFLSYKEGKYNFNNLNTEKQITSFFKNEFPDALKLIPNIIEEFTKNPTGVLGTVKCSPWHYQGKTLILGDAAHAIVPFYGQGMNAAFEDIFILDKMIDLYKGNWELIFKNYEKQRKPNTDAIADLAIENYYEMRDHVADPIFKIKRTIEMELEKKFPTTYFSKYSLVTFNEKIGYNQAHKKGNAQNKAIINLIKTQNLDQESDLNIVLKTITQETDKILKKQN